MSDKSDKLMKSKSKISLLENFPFIPVNGSSIESADESGLSVYSCKRRSNKPSCLVIKGTFPEDIVLWCERNSPEIYRTLTGCLERGSLFLDIENCTAWRDNGPDIDPETAKLVEALDTMSSFPNLRAARPITKGIVSVILGAGKGTRMRSKDFHKICFPIAGRPAINCLLDQLESVGIHQHIIIVGERGKQVVQEVTDVRDNVTFVYQINQNGTGNAAKQAAYLLHSHGFSGNALVVLGDKVIEKSALVRLLKSFEKERADCAVMTDRKKFWPDAGRIVFDNSGRLVDILEKRDIQKMIICGSILEKYKGMGEISTESLLNEIAGEIPSESKARKMLPELMEVLGEKDSVSGDELRQLIRTSDTLYQLGGADDSPKLSGKDLENNTPVTNAAVYMFTSDAFFDSIFNIHTDNAQKEEYFTEVIRLLARDTKRPWNIIPVPVKKWHEVLSYNNPEELLKIEEYYSHKESPIPAPENLIEGIDEKFRSRTLRPVAEWLNIFKDFGPEVKRRFRKIYGASETLHSERREAYIQALGKFIRVFGKNHSVIMSRSPGRVNLMGKHIEHRGGYTNYMTINREVILVAGIRGDDTIGIHNVDSRNFRPRKFSIGHELSLLPWDEWLDMISSRTVIDMIHASSPDWSNYFKASALRLQKKFRDRLLYGFNGVLSGQIPLAAGLSSSSAVVMAAAEALSFINGLSLVPRDFVDLCGEGDWFVGLGSTTGDYAAMKFGEKGNVIHMRFQDLHIEDIIPFPNKYQLIIFQSHQQTEKSADSMQIFNERVATYEISHELVKLRFPGLNDRIVSFRDINSENLGIEPWEIYDILLAIPEYLSRSELLEMLPSHRKNSLEKIFTSHEEPEGGYRLRAVAMFGLSEIERSRMFAEFLKNNEFGKAGHLMNISHNGDRISIIDEHGERIPYRSSISDTAIKSLKNRLRDGDNASSLYLQHGGFGCSTNLIDEMVDIALDTNGTQGAQISGAGLGGCIMALVRSDAVETCKKRMITEFYEKHNLRPEILVCEPIAGSGIFYL